MPICAASCTFPGHRACLCHVRDQLLHGRARDGAMGVDRRGIEWTLPPDRAPRTGRHRRVLRDLSRGADAGTRARGSSRRRTRQPQVTIPARILIVDDDETVLQTFAKALSLEGYDVRTAA